MTTIRQTAKVKADGTIELRNPALIAGAEVEVIVLVPAARDSTPEPYAFLKTLEDARLEGPVDWSEKLEDYLHGHRPL
jgi:hypothetical protein